jgi:hypothetical protein
MLAYLENARRRLCQVETGDDAAIAKKANAAARSRLISTLLMAPRHPEG